MKRPTLIATLMLSAFAMQTVPYALGETAPKADKKAATTAAADADMDKTYGAMQERYKKMQEQMEKIRQTKDPKERQKLLQEHWQTMHEGMGMMGGMGMGPGSRGGGMGMGYGPRGCPAGATPEATACRQNMMERRMDMMQMMMDQMMEHQGQSAPVAK